MFCKPARRRIVLARSSGSKTARTALTLTEDGLEMLFQPPS
jgi:hypothetical protein